MNKQYRQIRILHIGNVANNAYLNAKILNSVGIECDVMCHSYYHIMGNPEWEDADFRGMVNSEFFPDWKSVDLQGFRRPRWFAQGSLDICIRYLYIRREGDWWREQVYWRLLEWSRWLARHAGIAQLFRRARVCGRRMIWRGFSVFARLKWVIGKTIRLVYTAFAKILFMVRQLLAGTKVGMKAVVSEFESDNEHSVVSVSHADDLYHRLAKQFSYYFPDRKDDLLPEDIYPYLGTVDALRRLFEKYDIVQAYGTDPVFVMLTGKHPYLAFEHGTIRSLPFEETAQGRLTALAYRAADGVIITNADNVRAAERLHLPHYRFVPHPVNEKWMQPGIGQELRGQLADELDADFIVFHPARQHWEAQRHPSWEKGNDILIKGLARAIRSVSCRIAAVFVEWGKTVEKSKELLDELGIADRVKWIPPQHSANMARYIDACDVVADQFFLGAFGSLVPKALGMGKSAMLYLDEELHSWCFPEMPPVLNARTPVQVFECLKHAYEDREWLNALAQDGRRWYETYHSNAVIRDRLIDFYNDILKKYEEQ